jgi:hypothetical protein
MNTLVIKPGKLPHLQCLDLCLPQLEDVDRPVPHAVQTTTMFKVQDCTVSDIGHLVPPGLARAYDASGHKWILDELMALCSEMAAT